MADSNKNDSSVEFIGGNKYCRLRSHHHKAQAIIKENGGSFRGSFWVVAGGAEAASGDLIKRIREAATLDDKVQLASRVVMDADKASSLKVGEDHDFGPGVGVKPVLWVGRSFEGRDVSFDKRFSEQGLVGKEVAYVYHDNPPKEALRGKPAARTVEDQKRIAADASQRAASREVVEADALASVRMGEPFDFGGDVGVKPVLWVSAAFEARDAAHEPRFSERGLVGKQVAYVYHSSPPIKPLEKAAETDPAAAKALSIVKSGGVSAPKVEAPKAEAPKAEAPKAEAPKAETPKAETPKAEAPKAEAPKAEAPKAEAPKAEAPKAEAPKAEAPKAEAPKAEAPKAEAPKAEAPKAEDVGNATVSEAGALGMEDFAALGDLEDEIAAAAPVEKIENDDFSALEDLAGGLDDVGGL